MRAQLTSLLSGWGRCAVLYLALAAALVSTAWLLIRHGRVQAETEFAIRRAEARIRAMQTAKDIRHDVQQNAGRADLERRADRWMRD
ncbi:hypothetical protein [Salibaculum griseiflavum]|uniref:hypothetical protein n=1 Tax=Salibaculum griseiflavum TaxID=1914409 RepID=UPI0011B20E99|nr:hypothetical protein [Salibaculum griseiflavum]